MLAIFEPWRSPQAASAESSLPVERFASGAAAAGRPIEPLTSVTIGKYVSDLRYLNLI
jgi:hypothetical protein